jgi:hypothetical protein
MDNCRFVSELVRFIIFQGTSKGGVSPIELSKLFAASGERELALRRWTKALAAHDLQLGSLGVYRFVLQPALRSTLQGPQAPRRTHAVTV